MKGLFTKRGWWYYQPPTPKGGGARPKVSSLGTKDELEATRLAVKRQRELMMGRVREVGGRWKEETTLYLANKKAAGRHSPLTTYNTSLVLNQVGEMMGWPNPASLREHHIQGLRETLQKGAVRSEATVAMTLRTLKAFLGWEVERGVLPGHPMARMGNIRTGKTRRERYCTVQDRDVLMNGPMRPEVMFVLTMGFYAGLRLGEMIAMEWSWVWLAEDGLSGVLTVQASGMFTPKSGESRRVPLHPRVVLLLRSWPRGVGKGARFVLRPDKWQEKELPKYRFLPRGSLKGHCERNDLDWVGFHTLRHSFATHLASKGVPLAQIAGLLGDGLAVTEKHYVAYVPSDGGVDVL